MQGVENEGMKAQCGNVSRSGIAFICQWIMELSASGIEAEYYYQKGLLLLDNRRD